jgi:hypothetical protein
MAGTDEGPASGVFTPGGRGSWLSIEGEMAFLVSVTSTAVTWPAVTVTIVVATL